MLLEVQRQAVPVWQLQKLLVGTHLTWHPLLQLLLMLARAEWVPTTRTRTRMIQTGRGWGARGRLSQTWSIDKPGIFKSQYDLVGHTM